MTDPLTLIRHLEALDIRLRLEGGKVKADAPKGVLSPDLIELIKANKSEILALLEMPKPSTIWQIADLELAPIISTLTEPAYLSLEWGEVVSILHKITPAADPTDHLEQARLKLERNYAGAVPPINTIKLEQQSSTLGRVSVPLLRTPPICKACVFWNPFNGTSRACSKKNIETHPLYFCDVASPNPTVLAFKEVTL